MPHRLPVGAPPSSRSTKPWHDCKRCGGVGMVPAEGLTDENYVAPPASAEELGKPKPPMFTCPNCLGEGGWYK